MVVVGAGFAGLTAAREVSAPASPSLVARGAQSRRRPRRQPRRSAAARSPSAAARSSGPTQDRVLAARPSSFGRRHLQRPTTQGDNVYINGGQRHEFSDTGPTGSAPPDPLILPELITVVALLDQMSTAGPGRRALDRRERRGDWTARRSSSWIDANTARPSVPPPRPGRHPADLRRRAARALAALRRSSTSRPRATRRNPGTFERNFNTRGRRAEEPLRGRFAGDRQRAGRRSAARGCSSTAGAPDRAGPARRDGSHRPGST